MEIINQKAEKLHETGIDLVARAARICYKSEGNKSKNKEFVKGLIKKGHFTPLQFWRLDKKLFEGTATPEWWNNFQQLYKLELLDEHNEKNIDKCMEVAEKFTDHTDWFAFEITTNIAIGRELRTHQKMSYCQESTRWCNYNKKGLRFIPCDVNYESELWITFDEEDQSRVRGKRLNYFELVEGHYNSLILDGVKPEIARGVLPLSTETTLVMGGFKRDWEHFFNVRLNETSGKVHPQMKELAQMIKLELNK